MTCQTCHTAEATIHLTDRTPSGAYEAAHYCEPCGREFVPGPPGEHVVVALEAVMKEGSTDEQKQELAEMSMDYLKSIARWGSGGPPAK